MSDEALKLEGDLATIDEEKEALQQGCNSMSLEVSVQKSAHDVIQVKCQDLEARCLELERLNAQLQSESSLATQKARQSSGTPSTPPPSTTKSATRKPYTPLGAKSLRHAFFEVAMSAANDPAAAQQ